MSKKTETIDDIEERDALVQAVKLRKHGAGAHADKRKPRGGAKSWRDFVLEEEEYEESEEDNS